jgi:hybrid cluster-associated redox disulfide protein
MPSIPTIHVTMAELIATRPGARRALARRGMACVGCRMARFETLNEAAEAYHFDPQAFLREIDKEGHSTGDGPAGAKPKHGRRSLRP